MKSLKAHWLVLCVVVSVCIAFFAGYYMQQVFKKEIERESYITVVDDLGREVKIKGFPERIISTAPSNTEILFKLGLADFIVGVTEYCDYPEDAKQKEKIGTFSTPNIEKIVSLKPDLVVATGGQEKYVERLDELDITVIALMPSDFDDVLQNIKLIGAVCNRTNVADRIVLDMSIRAQKITNTTGKFNESVRLKVYYEMWSTPFITCGPNSFVHDIIVMAGGLNIAGNTIGDYPALTEEYIISSNPDIILTTAMNNAKPDDIKAREGWSVINAIKNDRVYFVDGNLFERPGPRLVEGLELLSKLLYPDLFSHIIDV